MFSKDLKSSINSIAKKTYTDRFTINNRYPEFWPFEKEDLFQLLNKEREAFIKYHNLDRTKINFKEPLSQISKLHYIDNNNTQVIGTDIQENNDIINTDKVEIKNNIDKSKKKNNGKEIEKLFSSIKKDERRTFEDLILQINLLKYEQGSFNYDEFNKLIIEFGTYLFEASPEEAFMMNAYLLNSTIFIGNRIQKLKDYLMDRSHIYWRQVLQKFNNDLRI